MRIPPSGVPFSGPTQGGAEPRVEGPHHLSSSAEGGHPFLSVRTLSVFSAADGELTTLALVKRTGPSLEDALSLTLQPYHVMG